MLFVPIYWITIGVKKNNNIWLFGSWFGFGFRDNPRWMFEYCINHSENIASYWVVRSKKELLMIPEAYHDKVLIRGTLKYFYLTLRAGVVFYGHSPKSDIAYVCNTFKTKKYQLWHGCPIKKIGVDDQMWTNKPHKKNKTIKIIIDTIMPYRKEIHDRAFAMSEYDKAIFERVFLPSYGVVVTGYPRQDIQLRRDKNHKIDRKKRNILYAPTFRKMGVAKLSDFGLDIMTLYKLDSVLGETNTKLEIKLHPVVKLEDPIEIFENLKNLTLLSSDIDVSERVQEFEILITDYSSVCFDFLAQNKPTLYLWHDVEDYIMSNRSLYESIADNLWGPVLNNWNELIVYIKNINQHEIDLKKRLTISKHKFSPCGCEGICQNIFDIVINDITTIR